MGEHTKKEISDLKDQYWAFLSQVRMSYHYIDFYYERSSKVDRYLSMGLTIASSAAIAGWVVWQQIPQIWVIVIGASQVVSAIRPFLPWGSRVDKIPPISRHCGILFTECESTWNRLETVHAELSEYVEALSKYKREYVEIECELYSCKSLPISKGLMLKSQEERTQYFKTFFKTESMRKEKEMNDDRDKRPLNESQNPPPQPSHQFENGEKRALFPVDTDIPQRPNSDKE